MLKELVVISGKGGTGKTSIVAALASLLPKKVMADCDVDAADLHLVLQPQVLETEEFWSGKTASINQDKCIKCGKCRELCRYAAINNEYVIDKVACEGCGVCVHFCPVQAIDFTDNLCGHMFVSTTPYGYMVHAKLGIAEENSGKLVTLVKSRARKIAQAEDCDTIIVDGPPGIGCPVIASVSGASLILAVTEPTVSGIHDLQRVLELTTHFHIASAVCINKMDINPEMADLIVKKCKEIGIEVIGQLPYDEAVTKAQVQGISIIDYDQNSPASKALHAMAAKIPSLLQTN